MKKVKILAALAALMTLGLAACTDTPTESVEGTSAAATSQAASANTSKAASASSSKAASSSKQASSSKSTGPDYTQVLPRTWTEGQAATNSSGKQYIPLTDATSSKVGVKIKITDYTVETGAADGTGLDSNGKVVPQNDHNAILTYKITAPKAGDYQMIMRAKSSTSNNALEKTLADRYFKVTLNGQAVDVGDDRVPLTADTADFVAAPTIHLTGSEDTFTFTAPDYRPVFDLNSYITFSEH